MDAPRARVRDDGSLSGGDGGVQARPRAVPAGGRIAARRLGRCAGDARTTRCRASRRGSSSRALALDPNHPKALALAATAALERKDYDGAIAQWHEAAEAQVSAGDAEEVQAVRRDDRGSGKPRRHGRIGVGARSMRPPSRAACRSIRNCAGTRRPATRCSSSRAPPMARGCRSHRAQAGERTAARLQARRLDGDDAGGTLSTAGEVDRRGAHLEIGQARRPRPATCKGGARRSSRARRDVNIVIDDVVR